LSEGHDEEVIPALEGPHAAIAPVLVHDPPKRVPRKEVQQLRKNRSTFVHRAPLRLRSREGGDAAGRVQIDDRPKCS
jgi:hypothetical protein